MKRLRNISLSLLAAVAFTSLIEAAEIAPGERRSGASFMSVETQAMQNDATANPGMLWVLDGEALWTRKPAAGRACADCHGDASSMRGVAVRYPAFDDKLNRPVDLEQRVNLCRVDHQQLPPLADESRDLLALTALIGRQSQGMPIETGADSRLQAFIDKGRDAFMRRQGQLNLACTNCHDDNWDKRLAGSAITQAHPTGYPVYRLEWQGLGSLKRRLRNCMIGVRTQPYSADAPEMVELELYLMSRARGMASETPAVRP
ncbi:sulfur-oxidizing protein SoxA [Tardiphaga robiniae]|uniref:sulfur oxidation c-type cytochrome SoxA n=1 Tax=Tardiphaga robiniae TaxID=943830 RepID=UPI0028587C61|nr:sulfur oxidation c-type cytochrome SoxA [Tardiphaga robiniae]MDR6663187.1 sulfur-oxidizing protein SoxA [Tardiphaga robiniae]